MTDVLGWRKVFAVVAPSTNTRAWPPWPRKRAPSACAWATRSKHPQPRHRPMPGGLQCNGARRALGFLDITRSP